MDSSAFRRVLSLWLSILMCFVGFPHEFADSISSAPPGFRPTTFSGFEQPTDRRGGPPASFRTATKVRRRPRPTVARFLLMSPMVQIQKVRQSQGQSLVEVILDNRRRTGSVDEMSQSLEVFAFGY